MPLSKPGIAIGSIFVITLVMGDFVTVGVMGGQQIASVGKVIQVQMALPAIPGRRRQRHGAARRRAADDRWALTPHDRHPPGALSDGPAPRPRLLRAGRRSSRLYVLFLYGPTLTILVLRFQGPYGGLTFPMNGVSTHWFAKLWAGVGVVDIWAAFRRSLALGLVVMALTVRARVLRRPRLPAGFRGGRLVFTLAVASLIVPSIVVSLGIGAGVPAPRRRDQGARRHRLGIAAGPRHR